MPLKIVNIDSPYPVEKVRERLRTIMRQEEGLLSGSLYPNAEGDDSVAFQGILSGNHFKLRRIVKGRNSFLPTVRGTILPTPSGAEIRLVMTLNPFVAVFMAFWFSAFVLPLLTGQEGPPVLHLAMIVFGVVLVAVGFYPEANRAERAIRECAGAA